MDSSKGRSNRFTSSLGDYYPISQFKQLSQRVAAQTGKNNHPLSPREEIYKSLLRELRSKGNNSISPLVKKASGILRLSHIKETEVSPSRTETNREAKKAPTNNKFSTRSAGDEISSLGLRNSEVISKLAENGGDFSEIWNGIKGYATSDSSSTSTASSSRYRTPSRQIAMSRASTATSRNTTTSQQGRSRKPPWRYFGNQNLLSSDSSSNMSVDNFVKPTRRVNQSDTSTGSSKDSTWSKGRASSSSVNSDVVDKKLNYLKHVFVIRGQVVTFKGQGFESFSNWFGDMNLLKESEANHKPLFRKDLDLSGFTNQEIHLKLYEGHKLVIEAYRPNRDNVPPLRFKSTLVLPKDIPVERFIICRNTFGRLIIQDTLRPWTM